MRFLPILFLFQLALARTHGLTDVAAPGPRICFGSLPADWQAPQVTSPAVRANVLQALNVKQGFPPQLTLNFVFFFKLFANSSDFFAFQFFWKFGRRNLGTGKNIQRRPAADAV